MLYCFLDTNIFIHCQDIKDIDWKSEFGESEVCLVIAPVVFEELDSFKDDPRNSRKRDRARRANKLLETILDSPARLVKDDVHLDESEGLDGYEFGVYNLSPANNDDRLVASMIAWSHEYRDDELILVSHDSGPRRKARRAGLTAKQLSDKYQLPDQLDPRDKKIRELKSKLAKIEDAQPNLHLGFQSKTGSIEHFSLAAVDLSAEYIAEDEVRSFVEGKRSEIMRNSDIDERHFAFFDKFGRDMTRTDIPEFGDHVERWLSFEYAPFLRARSIKEVFHSRAAKVALTLQNIGFGTADGLNISLLIRGSWKLELESPDDPKYPDEPLALLEWRTTPDAYYSDPLSDFSANSIEITNPANAIITRALEVNDPNLKVVKFSISKLRPDESKKLDPLFLFPKDVENVSKNIEIEYEILKDNPGPKQTGTLCIRVNKDSA